MFLASKELLICNSTSGDGINLTFAIPNLPGSHNYPLKVSSTNDL
jgi:hypothetical protein